METLHEKHVTGTSDNPGRFTNHQRTEAETTLEPVAVQLASGHTVHLTPGVFDGQAQNAMAEGQCVAFAVALADALGQDEIGVLVDTADGDRVAHAWVEDPEDSEQMLDSNGAADLEGYLDEFFRNRRENCGSCEGCWSEWGDEVWACENPTGGEAGLEVRYLPIDQMRTIETDQLGRGLPPQNWVIARSFITPLMTKIGR